MHDTLVSFSMCADRGVLPCSRTGLVLSESWRTSSAGHTAGSNALSAHAASISEHGLSPLIKLPSHGKSGAELYDGLAQGPPTLTCTTALSNQEQSDTMSARLLAAIDHGIDSCSVFADRWVFVAGSSEGSQSYVQFARRCVIPTALPQKTASRA